MRLPQGGASRKKWLSLAVDKARACEHTAKERASEAKFHVPRFSSQFPAIEAERPWSIYHPEQDDPDEEHPELQPTTPHVMRSIVKCVRNSSPPLSHTAASQLSLSRKIRIASKPQPSSRLHRFLLSNTLF